MSFEIKEKDLLARIGRIRTRSGTIETPLLFPVINPVLRSIPPRKMREEFGFEAIITNAYILKKRPQTQLEENGLHKFLDFNGTIMTDSGAYQILIYGDIEVTSQEIIEYQERIGPDIATILDIPTGWKVTETRAQETVKETLKRAKDFFKSKTREDILWVGPVQGGKYLDLVAKSAKNIGKLPFEIHALGSPTEIMERYRFDVLVDMIITAKMNLPIEKPLHLFGAGHPFMFALAVALGCDLFDSAAYALYAKEKRYMTETGTSRLNELDYFPCSCPKCTRTTPKKVSELPQKEAEVFLAEHNLYVCAAELRRVKQAIRDGRLWEHVEMRAHGHPALLQAVKRFKKYQDFIEKHDSTVKKSGLFYFDSIGLMRPGIIRHERKMAERYTPAKEAKILLLVPQTRTKPFHRSKNFIDLEKKLGKWIKDSNKIDVCFYSAPFGVVPVELDEIYPLSQHEVALPLDKETMEHVTIQVADFINSANYETVILINDRENWKESVVNSCRKVCLKKKTEFKLINSGEKQMRTTLAQLERILKKNEC